MGISRKLPPYISSTAKPSEIKKRNIIAVFVNANDQIFVNDNLTDIYKLKTKTIDLILNTANNPNLPEKSIKYIDLIGNIEVSNAIISIQNNRNTSYEIYVQVQNELTAAVNKLRNQLSKEKFATSFENLKSETKREAIQKAIPVNISEAEPNNLGEPK